MTYYIELIKKTLRNIVTKIKSLQIQIEDLKKENEILKEILTSKFDFNENNESNNNIDNTWKTVKTSRSNTVNNKVSNKRFISIDVSNKYQPVSIHENEVTEPRINNRMNNDIEKYKNADIPGYTKYNEAVRFGRKGYVLGTSMLKGIRRNEF